ncbi:succinate dehydrogenase cytochrome b subunit [Flaviflexus massiliensis]|uniref:succinate dehydrogenase cytochrome b subunit n=1 Tax=Flaviflexus massiliensis TaxID=1522309 RepID=UPI0006D571E0|nr:succinate dehydrogenase cytochrome b subunit [Flaviflexus massiliensis]
MATSTTTAPKKVGKLSTSVGLKIQMAVSGLIFVLFVLFHMYGNLKMFNGPEAYNGYAQFLRDVGYPIVPHGSVLWILRIILLVALVLHARAAIILWRRGKAARGPNQYKVKRGKKNQQTYASRTMRWGGIILLLFIVWHLLQFTTLTISVGADDYSALTPYDRMIAGFQPEVWWGYAIYLIAILALCLHIRHGAWSALQTLGWSNRHREPVFHGIAIVIAAIIFIGFMAPPTAILFGLIP